MGSTTQTKLPSIDFSNVDKTTNSLAWDLTRSQVHDALIEFGCFEATFTGIPSTLQKTMYEQIQHLFELPLETKLKNKSTKPLHAYAGQYPTVPLYESMGIDHATTLENVEKLTKVLWPEGNPKFSNTMHDYSEKLSKLDQMVRMMILESLGLEKYKDEHMDSTTYLLRVMKYTAPEKDEPELGLNSHSDNNTITILHQNEIAGLEMQTKSGEWIQIQPSFNSYTVMLGGALHAWTNGRLHSPFHQVIMRGKADRYSLGLFSEPKAGYVIKAPTELVDEEHPICFKPYEHYEFLDFYYNKLGLGVTDALKTYCGL